MGRIEGYLGIIAFTTVEPHTAGVAMKVLFRQVLYITPCVGLK